MILIDLSQICIAVFYKMGKDADELALSEDDKLNFLLNGVLQSIRMYNVKFKRKYGEMVICADSRSWRYDRFPNYKFQRKLGLDASQIQVDERKLRGELINKSVEVLGEYFPQKLVKVDGAEADDIIGTLAFVECEKECVVISTDNDFKQLKFKLGVDLYSPVLNKFIESSDEELKLHYITHILKGDTGDGIPNIFSPDNQFSDDDIGRQKPVSKFFISHGLENFRKLVRSYKDLPNDEYPRFNKIFKEIGSETIIENLKRNIELIDLRFTPNELKKDIYDDYKNSNSSSIEELNDYLTKNRMTKLLENSKDFIQGLH